MHACAQLHWQRTKRVQISLRWAVGVTTVSWDEIILMAKNWLNVEDDPGIIDAEVDEAI